MVPFSPRIGRNGLKQLFPEELLHKPFSERKLYFGDERLLIDHPMLTATLKRLRAALEPGLNQSLVLLLGPTGVGKSVLIELLISNLFEELFTKWPEDRVSIPGIHVEANPPEEGRNFDFRELYVDSLIALRAPLIDETLPMIERSADGKTLMTPAPEIPFRIPQPRSLRRRLRTYLRGRNTQVFAIDEAVHALTVDAYRDDVERLRILRQQGNCVKSLVNGVSASIVCAGAYDFYELALASEQLARRAQIVPFFEYSATPDGIQGYTDGLLGLLSHLPLDHDLNPDEIAADLFVQSLGRIGMTRTILFRFLLKVELGEKPDKATLANCFYPEIALKTMEQAAATGRRLIEAYLSSNVPEGWSPKVREPQIPPAVGGSGTSTTKLRPGETTPDRRWQIDPPSIANQ